MPTTLLVVFEQWMPTTVTYVFVGSGCLVSTTFMFTLTVDVATIANHRMFCKLTMVRCAMIYLRGVIKCASMLSLSVDSLSIFKSLTEIGSLRNGNCVRANTMRCNAL